MRSAISSRQQRRSLLRSSELRAVKQLVGVARMLRRSIRRSLAARLQPSPAASAAACDPIRSVGTGSSSCSTTGHRSRSISPTSPHSVGIPRSRHSAESAPRPLEGATAGFAEAASPPAPIARRIPPRLRYQPVQDLSALVRPPCHARATTLRKSSLETLPLPPRRASPCSQNFVST